MSVSLTPINMALIYTANSDAPHAWMPVSEIDDDRVVGFTVHTLTVRATKAGLEPTHVILRRRGHEVRRIALPSAA